MILTVTLNPCVDLLLFLPGLQLHDTNRVQRSEKDAGGKGVNVARVAAELGASTAATGWIGGGAGAYVQKVIQDQGVACRFLWIEGETRVNVSVEDGTGEPPTTFNMRGPETTSEDWEKLQEEVAKLASESSWVCLGGSLPPSAPKDAWRTLTTLARQQGAKVVLDADGEEMKLGMEAGPTLIKPNRKEAERLLGRSLETRGDAAEAAQELGRLLSQKGSGAPYVILSLGSEGAVLSHQGELLFAPPAPVEVKSTIGSGDSLIGGFLAGLHFGLPLSEALALGAAAGAATAATDGTEIARKAVVDRLLPHVRVESLA